MNLLDLDPATLMPSAEYDVKIATEWMRWQQINGGFYKGKWLMGDRSVHPSPNWSPTTNVEHAGEARRMADGWAITTTQGKVGSRYATVGIYCELFVDGLHYHGRCRLEETNGDPGLAEALATSRAIWAAMGAREKAEGREGG